MKPYKISIGKLINQLKLIESDSKNHKKDLKFLIDCLSDEGITNNEGTKTITDLQEIENFRCEECGKRLTNKRDAYGHDCEAKQ